MASFRNVKTKASYAIRDKVSHGTARHNNKECGLIHSVGTERSYTQALAGVQSWLNDSKAGDLKNISIEKAMQYLQERAGQVRQKTLDLDRQALQVLTETKLGRVKSAISPSRLATETRSYSPEQIKAIASAQNARYALATEIAHAAGLRAHELITILPVEERVASTHREWSNNRFEGREGKLYTIVGKGGLVTEKLLPVDLADRLEARRLGEPQKVRDRGINYLKHYDLGSGKKWSEDFSRISAQVLGFSNGGHGLRHSYAQERESELQARGYTLEEARGVVSNELGHFSSNTTRRYER